jgi:radical SAM superfamily enzyme YgiQ (UPF0313 family)
MRIAFYCARYGSEQQAQLPLGLGYLGGYLEQQGLVGRADICYAATCEEALGFAPDILCVSATSQVIDDAYRVARAVREARPAARCVLGGYHVTAVPAGLQRPFDVGVLGEGEKVLADLVRLAAADRWGPAAFADIKGVCYPDADGSVRSTRRPPPIEDLDGLPLPHRQFTADPVEGYLFTSRGCPYRCIYCASSVHWGACRYHSPERVVREIEQLHCAYGAQRVYFLDDLFAASKPRLGRIVDRLEQRGLLGRVSYHGFVRANLVDESMARLLVRMGFDRVRFGAESGSERILSKLKCGTVRTEQNQHAVDVCHAAGLRVGVSMVFGTPGETEQDLALSREFLRRNRGKCHLSGFYLLTPYPGTQLWMWAKQCGLVDERMDWRRLALDFLKPEFDWERAVYLNEDVLPRARFRRIIEDLRGEFLERTGPPAAPRAARGGGTRGKGETPMRNDVRQYLASLGSGLRVVASCWANDALIESYLALARSVQARTDAQFLFVTTNRPEGRDKFLARGVVAVTMQELADAAADRPAPELDDALLEPLVAADRARGYRPLADRDGVQEEYYRWAARRVLAGYRSLLDAFRPDVVCTWNGTGGVLNAASALAARQCGVPTFFLERGLLPGTLVVDPEGVNYASHVAGAKWRQIDPPDPTAAEADALREYCRELAASSRSVVRHGGDADARSVRAALQIPADARVVLGPLQIESDTNITRYSPHYKRMPRVIRDVQAALADRQDVLLVVKPHPEDRDRLAELRGLCGPRARLCSDLSLHSLLAVADVVVTINSTVGLEALVCRKPVVVLGDAIYSGKGFTFDVEAPSALRSRLGAALRAAETGSFAEGPFFRFLAYLLKHCLLPLSDEDRWGAREWIAARLVATGAASSGDVPAVSAPWEALLSRVLARMHRMTLTAATGPISTAASKVR